MNLSADMSIIEIDNLIKSLPKERLQKELESPTGHFPLYLVAGRLKEMESMEADAQAAAAEKKTSEQAPSVAHRLAMTQPPVMSEVAAAPQPLPQPDPAGQAAQMLMPTVNAVKGYTETGKQGANTSELVNQYLAELKSRKDKAEEKRLKTDEFAVDNSGDFAKNMGKQPFGKGGIADLGSLADLRAAQVKREERSDPTPTPSDEKTKGRFTGGVSGVHSRVANESENTDFDKMLAQLIKESNKSRSAKKANQGGYVRSLPTTYAQDGYPDLNFPFEGQKVPAIYREGEVVPGPQGNVILGEGADYGMYGFSENERDIGGTGAENINAVKDLDRQIETARGVAQTYKESDRGNEARRSISELLQARSDLINADGTPSAPVAPVTPRPVASDQPVPPKNLSGTDVLKAMNAKTRQNRASTDGAVGTGDVVTPTSSDNARILADQKRMQQKQTILPPKEKDVVPPVPLEPMPQLPKSAIIKSLVKRNSSLSGKNDGVSETKIVSNARSPYMDKILSLSSELEASDNASKVAMKDITNEIARLGTFKRGALKKVETANKAVMDFAKTGKLPPERKDKLINSLLMTFGASLLGNPTLAGALSKGLMASQKIMRGEEDAYSDALSANLKSVQAMTDSKITLETATANAKVKSLAFARQDARASDANRNAAIANLQTAENARLTALDRYQKNQLSAERNRIQMLQATQLTGPQITQLNREKIIQGKYDSYVSDFALAKNDAERRKVFEKYKPFFTVEPETKTLDINKPKLPAFNKDFKLGGVIKETRTGLSPSAQAAQRRGSYEHAIKQIGNWTKGQVFNYRSAGQYPEVKAALDVLSQMDKYKNIKNFKTTAKLDEIYKLNPSFADDLKRIIRQQYDAGTLTQSSNVSQSSPAGRKNSNPHNLKVKR